jgi:trk system potassium uptake protein TrkH
MNHRFIAKVLGQIQVLMALAMLLALPWSLVYRDGDHLAIIESVCFTAALGVALWMFGRRAPEGFYRREALAIVGLGWLLSAATGALPFIFSGLLSPVDAYFECMSGLTTTGATVISDINAVLNPSLPDAIPRHSVMFWRSLTHWLGGMGIVVLLLALLPAVGAGTKFLFHHEAPGPTAEGLKPRIRETALRLWLIYVGLSVVECVLLWVNGMTVFDAMCHTFGTMATGGFSTQNASVGAFHSLRIELIIIVFMVLAGTNFNLHYRLAHRDWLAWLRNPEWRVYGAVLAIATAIITVDLALRGSQEHAGIGTLLRWSSFTVVSITTTTGFCTADFDAWPNFSRALLVVLMFMGGCAGSTGGGVKVVRAILLFKIAGGQIQRIFNPRLVRTMRLGGVTIDSELQQAAVAHFLMIVLIFLGASLVMAAFDLDLVTAATSVAATLNNIGPGLAGVGATHTYADIPTLGKLVLTFCMVAGRLEIWAILCLFAPRFWRTR